MKFLDLKKDVMIFIFLYNHDVLVVVIAVRKPLISDFDLREVKAARLSAGPAAGDGADGQAVSEEGTVDLPGAKTRTQTPDVLKISSRNLGTYVLRNQEL
jgi:hypothetical protein